MLCVVVLHLGLLGMNRFLMDDFDSFTESFLSRDGKLLICGDFNYWVDDLAHKPYFFEFMELLNIINFENSVLTPIHTSGHTVDLGLLSVDSGDVDE